MTLFILLLCLFFSSLSAQNRPNPEFRDTAVIPSFRKLMPEVVHFTTLLRHRVDDTHDLLLVRGGEPKDGWNQTAGVKWWTEGDLLGLFLQVRERPGLVYNLSIASLPNDGIHGVVGVERVTSSELAISRYPEKGLRPPNIKFFFSVRSKNLRKNVSYYGFQIVRVVEKDGVPLFVAANGKLLLVIRPTQDHLGYEIARGDAADPILGQVGTFTAPTPEENFAAIRRYFEPFSFGPNGRFRLTQQQDSSWGPRKIIVDGAGPNAQKTRLPRSSLADYRRLRPEDARRTRAARTGLSEEIGPTQLFEGRLWFGKCFYNSEGCWGVGGFGYFDPQVGDFKIFIPPEIRDWSASALLVEQDQVWAGLMYRGEYGNSPGGLLRWDRTTEHTQLYELPAIINTITRHHGRLHLGTNEGLAILEDNGFRRFMIDMAFSGEYQVVAR